MTGRCRVIPAAIGVGDAAHSLRTRRDVQHMRRIQRPVERLRRRQRRAIHDDLHPRRIAGDGHAGGRVAVEPVNCVDIGFRVPREIRQRNSRRNRFQRRPSIPRKCEWDVRHDGAVVVQREVLRVVQHLIEVRARTFDDVVVVHRHVSISIRARLLVPKTYDVPHFMQQCSQRAVHRAARWLPSASTPNNGVAHSIVVRSVEIEIDIIRFAAARHKLNQP